MSGLARDINRYMQINLENKMKLNVLINSLLSLARPIEGRKLITQWLADFQDPEEMTGLDRDAENQIQKLSILALSLLALSLVDRIKAESSIGADPLFFLIFQMANETGLLKKLIINLTEPDQQNCFLLEDHCDRMSILIPLIVQYWDKSYRQIYELISSVEFLDPSSEAIESLKANLKRNKIPKEIHENLLLIPKNYFSQSYPDNTLFFDAWRVLLTREDLLENMTELDGAFSSERLDLLEGRGLLDLMTCMPEFNLKFFIHTYVQNLFVRKNWKRLTQCLGCCEVNSDFARKFREYHEQYCLDKKLWSTPQEAAEFLGFRVALKIKAPLPINTPEYSNEYIAGVLVDIQENLAQPASELFLALEQEDISKGSHDNFKQLLTAMRKTPHWIGKISAFAENFRTARVGDARFEIFKNYLNKFYFPYSADDFSLQEFQLHLDGLLCFLRYGIPAESSPCFFSAAEEEEAEKEDEGILRPLPIFSEEDLLHEIFFYSDDPIQKIQHYTEHVWIKLTRRQSPVFLMGNLRLPGNLKDTPFAELRLVFSLITLEALKTRNTQVLAYLLCPDYRHLPSPRFVMDAIVYQETIARTQEDAEFLLNFLCHTWAEYFLPSFNWLNFFFQYVPKQILSYLDRQKLRPIEKTLKSLLDEARIPSVLIERLRPFIQGNSRLEALVESMIKSGLVKLIPGSVEEGLSNSWDALAQEERIRSLEVLLQDQTWSLPIDLLVGSVFVTKIFRSRCRRSSDLEVLTTEPVRVYLPLLNFLQTKSFANNISALIDFYSQWQVPDFMIQPWMKSNIFLEPSSVLWAGYLPETSLSLAWQAKHLYFEDKVRLRVQEGDPSLFNFLQVINFFKEETIYHLGKFSLDDKPQVISSESEEDKKKYKPTQNLGLILECLFSGYGVGSHEESRRVVSQIKDLNPTEPIEKVRDNLIVILTQTAYAVQKYCHRYEVLYQIFNAISPDLIRLIPREFDKNIKQMRLYLKALCLFRGLSCVLSARPEAGLALVFSKRPPTPSPDFYFLP